MRKLTILLWLQLIVGVVGLYLSFWGVHSGGLGMEWAGNFQREFEKAMALPGYCEPPVILGLSHERVVEWLRDAARGEFEAISYCFYLSGGLSLFAIVELILVASTRRQLRDSSGRQKSHEVTTQ
jgi:hypothetical protein